MSHHNLPRVHFRGEFRANVTTANNDDIASAFPAQQFVDVARVRLDTHGMDDTAFAAWIRQMSPPFGIRAGWNLYGDGYCRIASSVVQSVRTGTGLRTTPADDSLVGATVTMPRGAVMVDVDPEGTLGTQVFCDEIRFAVGSQTRILGRPIKFCSRDVVRRNLGATGFTAFSASWFAAIPPGSFSIAPANSPVLAELKSAADAGSGLFVAFCTYLLEPQISQAQLAADFANGVSTRNPAIGRWIGTLGVWSPGDLQTVAVGRRLFPGATLQHDRVTFRLNPATATVHPGRSAVTLDLLSTFPEVDETLEKVQIGSIRLGVVTVDGGSEQLQDIGEVAYDRAAYERESGLVDVPYPGALQDPIDRGRLVLYRAGTNTRVLAETRWTVETDDRCVYLQEGETAHLSVRLHDRGRLPSSNAAVRIVQYETTNRIFASVSPADGVVDHDLDCRVPAGGTGILRVAGRRAGVCVVALLPPDEADDSLEYFLNIRVLPRDDYDQVPDAELTFDFVYQEVLRYYHLLYPAMSERFDLSDQLSVELKAQVIKDRIAASMRDKVAYMPVTRDLSDGKRRLLERWCDRVLGVSP